MNDELSNCPFCGSKASIIEVTERPDSFVEEAFIQCEWCGFSFHHKWLSVQTLIKYWNKRVLHCDDDFIVIRKPKKPFGNVNNTKIDTVLTDMGMKTTYKNLFIPDIDSIIDYVNESTNYEYERIMFKYIAEAYGWKVM